MLIQVTIYLLISEGIHIAYDLSCHLPCLGRSVLERSLDNRHYQGKRWCVDKVHKLCFKQGL